MKWIKENKNEIQLISAVLMLVIGAILLMCGFIVAPLGIIDNSVLIGFGEILTFVGAIFGVDYKYKSVYKNKDKDEDTNK